jgi:hypothetical protein
VADQATRGAARLAAGIALPVALIAGLLAYRLFGGFGAGTPRPAVSPTPQATGVVAMPAPSLPERPATVCRALLAALPQALRDQRRRPVSAGPEQNAAYGDPPITLACGNGPKPPVGLTDDVYALSGVCWFARPGQGSTAWTALDREVTITVTVPDSYPGQGQWVIEFSAPIVSAVPATTANVPSGCQARSGAS